MSKKLSQIIGAGVLLVWGSVMIYFYVSGRISVYLAQEFRIFTLVAGLGLCVLGAFNLLTRTEEVDCCHGHDHDHDHDHGAAPLGVIPLIFLLVPLLVAARISPDGFNATAISNKGVYNPDYEATPIKEQFDLKSGASAKSEEPPLPVEISPQDPGVAVTESVPAEETPSAYGEYTLADLEAQVDKSPEGNYILTVPQLFYTAGDEELQRVLKGLPIESVGQVMPEEVNNAAGTRLRVFRLFIECCAADARPLSIPLEFGKAPPEYKEMGWIKVVGKMSYVQEDGMTVPILEVESMEETAPPEDEMIF